MSETLSLNKSKYISANDLPKDLKEYINRTFIIKRNSTTTAIKLLKVKGKKVYLGYPDGRSDGYSLSHAEFKKFYMLAP